MSVWWGRGSLTVCKCARTCLGTCLGAEWSKLVSKCYGVFVFQPCYHLRLIHEYTDIFSGSNGTERAMKPARCQQRTV